MSRLYYSEEGRVMPSLCEELTIFRRARKTLTLPATNAPGIVYILARPYPENEAPLRIAVNGVEIAALKPMRPGAYSWYEFSVEKLKEGKNTFELWTDHTAMASWSLAMEAGHPAPGSAVSDDGGQTWRSERMGYLNAVLGEYVIRVRLAEGEDPPPPPMVWENADSPRFESLRQMLPPVARDEGPLIKRVRALSSYLASSWEHTGSARAEQYAPWDAETLLAWAPGQIGHNGKRPVAMCVHYAAAFVSCAQAIGIPARCAVLTEAVNSFNGHFVAEVWFDHLDKWVVVDPNTDALFIENGKPMSMGEIQAAGKNLKTHIEYGRGTEFQRTFPHIVEFMRENLEKGVCFQHRSVWYRSDLLGHPEFSPPAHGSLSYCETGLVWEHRDRGEGFGMFPYFGNEDYFNAAPIAEQSHWADCQPTGHP